jgi:hypothetical protein
MQLLTKSPPDRNQIKSSIAEATLKSSIAEAALQSSAAEPTPKSSTAESALKSFKEAENPPSRTKISPVFRGDSYEVLRGGNPQD